MGKRDSWTSGKKVKRSFSKWYVKLTEAVEVVIPTKPTNNMFLISLTKGPNRKFITVSEDDIIDLPDEATIRESVTKTLQDAISAL